MDHDTKQANDEFPQENYQSYKALESTETAMTEEKAVKVFTTVFQLTASGT